MKNVLCYGDSNTFGYIPVQEGRYSYEDRWTGILQKLLGQEFRIIEEGCGGRTTVFEDPIYPHKNGKDYILPCIESHKPLDLIIIMLGTNDLKTRFNVSVKDIAQGMKQLVNMVKTYEYGVGCKIPEILIVCPIRIGKNVEKEELSGFSKEAVMNSKKLPSKYKFVAEFHKCHFLDAGKFADPSTEDSIHLTKKGHKDLAKAISIKIKQIFK